MPAQAQSQNCPWKLVTQIQGCNLSSKQAFISTNTSLPTNTWVHLLCISVYIVAATIPSCIILGRIKWLNLNFQHQLVPSLPLNSDVLSINTLKQRPPELEDCLFHLQSLKDIYTRKSSFYFSKDYIILRNYRIMTFLDECIHWKYLRRAFFFCPTLLISH